MNTPMQPIKASIIFVGILVLLIGLGMIGQALLPKDNVIDTSIMDGGVATDSISSDKMIGSSQAGIAVAPDIAPSSYPYYPIPYGRTSLDPNRQLITNSQLNIIVDDLRARSLDLEEKAKGLGGFASSSSTTSLTDGTEQAYLTLRVPSDKVDSLLQSIRSLALRIVDEQKQTDDATDQLIDIEVRLKTLRESETQYGEILKEATNVDDILRITQARADLRQQIEQLESQKQSLDSQVAFSTVSVTMSTETGLPSQPSWQPSQQLKLAWQAFLSGLTGTADLAIIGVVMLPLLALWLGILWIVGRIGWRIINWIRRQLFPNN